MKARENVAQGTFGTATALEQARLAMPTARQMLVEGIEYHARLEETFIEKVAGLLGDEELEDLFVKSWPDSALAVWTARFDAARAIGIALGLMLRPEILSEANGGDQ